MADQKKDLWGTGVPKSTWGTDAKAFDPDTGLPDSGGKQTLNFGDVCIRIVSPNAKRVDSLVTILNMVHEAVGDDFDVAKFVLSLREKR